MVFAPRENIRCRTAFCDDLCLRHGGYRGVYGAGCVLCAKHFGGCTSANLAQETELIAAALDEQQEPIPFLRSLDREDLRITLINKDGSVAYDNEASPSTLPNHGDRPEVIEPLRVVRVPRSAQALHSTRLCCIAPSPLITARSFAWRRPSLALRRFCCRCWRDAAYRSSGCSTLVFYGAP